MYLGANLGALDTLDSSLPVDAIDCLPTAWWRLLKSGPLPLRVDEWIGVGGTSAPLSLGRVVLSDAGGVLVETYTRTETGWRNTDTLVDATASLNLGHVWKSMGMASSSAIWPMPISSHHHTYFKPFQALRNQGPM